MLRRERAGSGIAQAVQDGLSLGLDSTGTVTTETYDADGRLQGRETSPFAEMFVLRRATGARWLNVAVLPPGADG